MFAVSSCEIIPESVELFLKSYVVEEFRALVSVKNITVSLVNVEYKIQSVFSAPCDTVFDTLVSEFDWIFVFVLNNVKVNRKTYMVYLPRCNPFDIIS